MLLAESGFQSGFASNDPWLHLVFIELPIACAPAFLTWVLPGLFRYRRGGMAWIAAAIGVVFLILLPYQQVNQTWAEWYPKVHRWLFGVFYIYAVFGLALCGVGILDRKRSAIWGLVAVLSLVAGAIVDTVIWFGVFSGVPAVPYGFVGFCLALTIGYVRRSADPPLPSNRRSIAETYANNRTRRSRSIPRKLLREGNLHLLPVFYILSLSGLGKEGIENSGSYRFADHIYRMEPSGRTALGRWLDSKVLSFPATQAFHRRYKKAQTEIRRALESFPLETKPLRILAIPCGLPRDLTELAQQLQTENPDLLSRIEYHGMDIDTELLELAKEFTRDSPVTSIQYTHGNALLSEEYPEGPFHAVVSTGLGEFLKEGEVSQFYQNVYDVLAPGGTFFTSATREEKKSEWMMSIFELITQYRTTGDLEKIFRHLPWSTLTLVQDETGLQTFVVAVK